MTYLSSLQNFGLGIEKCQIAEEENKKTLALDKFDENNPEQFTTKVLFICGEYFGFRGISEHTELLCSHLENGMYQAGHPFRGKASVGFNGMAYKHHRLGVHRSVIENNKHWRIPVLNIFLQKDPGGTIVRYQNSWHPNQVRFHLYPLTSKQRSDATAAGFPHILYRKDKAIQKIRLVKFLRKVQKCLVFLIFRGLRGMHCVQNIAHQIQMRLISIFKRSFLQQGILL